MVCSECCHGRTVITLRPNRSASWRQTKLFLLVMATPMFIIAIGWSLLGAWLILPFAGLEFLLLSYLSYRVSCRSYRKDTIIIDKTRIIIHFGISDRPCSCTLQRPATYLHVIEAKKPLDLVGLWLADDNRRIEIGIFVNQQDRKEIRSLLKNVGLIECSDAWFAEHP